MVSKEDSLIGPDLGRGFRLLSDTQMVIKMIKINNSKLPTGKCKLAMLEDPKSNRGQSILIQNKEALAKSGSILIYQTLSKLR